ncbi:MAG: enoyl-CoA hydratase/isomerase family protein [Halanaeroarchaeum sp.]
MAYDAIDVETTDGRATVTLDDPDRLNVLTGETFEELATAFEAFAEDPPDVVTVRGAGGNFSAGVDMSAPLELVEERPLAVRDVLERFHEAPRAIEALDAPVVAGLEGYVLGGGLELALACDVRVGSADATFGVPEAESGLAMDFGGGQKLPGFVGEGMAKYLIMTGKQISAERAHEIQLIEEVAPEGEFEAALADLEDALAEKPTYVHGLAKRQIHAARPPNTDEQMRQAIFHAIAAYHEPETQRRVEAFLD